MNKIEKISYSLLIASAVTIFKFAHKKIGGLLSGGVYSDSHSWHEMRSFIPEFIIIFIVFLSGSLIFFFLIKKPIDAICPNCKNCFKVNELKTATCPDCKVKAEKLEGFYQRHPE